MEQENINSTQADNKKVCLFKRAKRPNVRQAQKSSSSENESGTDSDDSTDKKSVSKTAIYKREKQTKRGLSQRSNITTKKLKKSQTSKKRKIVLKKNYKNRKVAKVAKVEKSQKSHNRKN